MSKTVLQLVQSILNDMDSEPINALGDSLEAEQVASILSDTFQDIVYTEDLPEHRELLKLTAASDSAAPTQYTYADNVIRVHRVWYDIQENTTPTDAARVYHEITWCDPMDFIDRMDSVGSSGTDYDTILENSSGTTLRIVNNQHPSYYTSFDNKTIVMNSYNSTYDTTLQASKVRAYGAVVPTIDTTDGSHVVDLSPAHTQYLLRETLSRCFETLKGGTTPKMEQNTRRVRFYLQNDRYRTVQPNNRNDYGRR
jgi:hypothetical protein